MRILITGISGFIGCHLARDLVTREIELFGLADDPASCEVDAEVFEIDVTDAPALARAVDRCAPDVVVHLAGLSHVGDSWKRPGDHYRVNFVGTRNLLRVAAGKRVIVASSAEVYGAVPEDEQPIGEGRPLDPRSPYAMTKACAEAVARDHGAIVARAFNAIGRGQSRRFALPSFAAQLAAIHRGERAPVLRVGNLSPRRDFLHVTDVTAAYRTLIESGEPGGVYNIASGKACSIAETLDRLREISGVAAEVEPDESRLRPVEIPLSVGDSRRLRALGWAPEHSLGQALEEIWREAIESA